MLFDSLRPARPRAPALAHGAVVEVEGRPVRLKVQAIPAGPPAPPGVVYGDPIGDILETAGQVLSGGGAAAETAPAGDGQGQGQGAAPAPALSPQDAPLF